MVALTCTAYNHSQPWALLQSHYSRFFIETGLFCDGTCRCGVLAPFFPSKEKNYL